MAESDSFTVEHAIGNQSQSSLCAPNDEIGQQIHHDIQSNFHYDMPVEVFQYILGPSMKYSSGLWDDPHLTLDSAQEANLSQIVDSLGLTSASHVLDAGCGWGAFAIFVAKQVGCRVVGITLAPKQVEFARAWARAEGVDHLIDFRVSHVLMLSEPPNTFTHIVFLESIEHMRLKHDTVAHCRRMLCSEGMFYMQVIGLKSSSYRDKALTTAGNEYISQIYGGVGDPVPVSMMLAALEESDCEVMKVRSITTHYSPTLKAWIKNTRHHSAKIDALTRPGRAEAIRKYFMLSLIAYRKHFAVNHQIWARAFPDSNAEYPV